MKIEITKEQYELLKELQKELKTQNNRCTRNPVYLIMDKKEELRPYTHSDKYRWFNNDNSEVVADNDEDFFSYLVKNYENELTNYFEDDLKYVTLKEAFMDFIEGCDDFDIEDIGYYTKYYYEYVDYIPEANTFSFFERDAFEHLNANDYHYNENASTYACAMWRSSRMEKLLNFLHNINLNEY